MAEQHRLTSYEESLIFGDGRWTYQLYYCASFETREQVHGCVQYYPYILYIFITQFLNNNVEFSSPSPDQTCIVAQL